MNGKIILVPFPFTHQRSSKRRPGLVIKEKAMDVVVAFISSIVPPHLDDNCVLIKTTHPEFGLTGLTTNSIIRLDKVATIHKNLIRGEMGELGPQLKNQINQKLKRIFNV